MLRSWQPNDKFRKFLSSHPHPRESKIRIALELESLTRLKKSNATEKFRHERGSQEMKYMKVNKDRKMLVLLLLVARRFCVCMFAL